MTRNSGASVGYEHNPEKAKSLLAELGYKDGKRLEVQMLSWTGGNREKLLQVFQSQLKQVGIDAKIEIMDIGSLNARVKQENNITEGPGSFDLMGWSWYDLIYCINSGTHLAHTRATIRPS